MAKIRHPNIDFALKDALRNMYCPGESKKKHMDETRYLRAIRKQELLEQGYNKKDAHRISMDICTYRFKIFSDCTLHVYQSVINIFGDFCKKKLGTKRISVTEAATYVQDFLNWSIYEKKHSASTTHSYRSAICKALGLKLCDFDIPKRITSEFTRGIEPAKHDAYNKIYAAKALEINRIIGVRRRELGKVKLTDIEIISDHRIIVHTIGKGGKRNINLVFTEKEVATLLSYVDEAAAKGQVYLLTRTELKNDADLHSMRAERALEVYHYVVEDMAVHPECREYYIHEIKKVFEANKRKITENLSSPYRCIGRNRQMLINAGEDYVFDRVAVLFVSCFVTNHFRSNVTVNNYLIHAIRANNNASSKVR